MRAQIWLSALILAGVVGCGNVYRETWGACAAACTKTGLGDIEAIISWSESMYCKCTAGYVAEGTLKAMTEVAKAGKKR